jgi:hypothetical protein
MKKILIKMSLFAVSGALLGYAYYYFIGCRTGSCPLTGNPLITTLYGMLMGTVLGFDSRIFQLKKKKDSNNS